MGVVDELYKDAFVDTLQYQEQQMFINQDHFPVFLMGNSMQNLVRAFQTSGSHLSDIKQMQYESYQVKMICDAADSYLFNGISQQEQLSIFNRALLFNKEVSGLKIKDLNRDQALKKKLKPLAVFETGLDDSEQQIIAILEGIKVPIYAFTYGIELIQFYFENSTENLDYHKLDHSIIARTHAQFIASLIADELRMNKHSFADEDQIFELLARHLNLASVEF